MSSRLVGARAAIVFMAVGWAAIGVYFLVSRTMQDAMYLALGVAGVGAIVFGSRRLGAERVAWNLFAVGLACEVFGDSVSTYYELHLHREAPLPSLADVGYLGGYPILILGIFLLLRARGRTIVRAVSLDTLIVFAAVATVQWMFFVEPYRHESLSTGARLTSMAYPSLDALLLVGLAQLLVGVGRRTFAAWLLLASVALWIAGDELFALVAGHYSSGGWVDTFWLGSYVVWGGAALALGDQDSDVQADRRLIPRLTAGRLTMLAGALLAVPAALIVERTLRNRFHPIAAGIGASIIAVLVLVRLAGLVRAVDRARLDERRARREAELSRERIETQNAQLLEFDRLKNELLSSVSHELRTPLTSISGYVELLLEEEQGGDERRHLEIVQRNTQRLLGLVSDLLLAARLQTGELELKTELVDLGALVEHAVESAAPRAAAMQVALEAHVEPVPPVQGEHGRLSQLLDNLVSNAIKFTLPDGKVDVSLSRRDGVVRIEVSDTGIGLREDEIAKLFTRFYRADSAIEAQIPGTGLGLYIAKAIVDAHHGRIAVRSTAGEGTTFVVELPVG